MKLLSLTTAIAVALVSILPDACLSQTLVKGVKYPEVSSTQLPNCYIETSDSRILDLTKMCASSDEADNLNNRAVAQRDSRSSMRDEAARQSARNSRACDPDDPAFDESACEQREANRLPGVPY